MPRPRLYLRVLDAVMVPLLAIPLVMLRFFRRKGTARMPLLRALCMRLGVLPIRNHYYDPFIDPEQFTQPLSAERPLPQYLLEAFLAFNPRFEVVAGAHFLRQRHPEALLACCPALRELDGTPSSFWMRSRAA